MILTRWPILRTVAAPALPLAIVVVLVTAYVLAQAAFIECRGIGCQRTTLSPLFQIDSRITVDPDNHALVLPGEIGAALTSPDTALRKAATAHRREILSGVVRQYNGRFVWSFFVVLGFVAALGAAVSVAVLMTRTREEAAPPYAARLAGVWLPGIVVSAAMIPRPHLHMNLMGDILSATAGKAPLGVGSAKQVMNVVNSIDMGVSVALVFACCALLFPVSLREVPERAEAALKPIWYRLRLLRIFLYVSTTLLVVGILRMQSVTEWVVTFLPPADAEILTSSLRTRTWAMGAFFTLVLAGTYLPSALILRKRAAATIDRVAPAEERKEHAERLGLMRSPTEWLPRLAAILAPLLAGPIGQMLQTFTKG